MTLLTAVVGGAALRRTSHDLSRADVRLARRMMAVIRAQISQIALLGLAILTPSSAGHMSPLPVGLYQLFGGVAWVVGAGGS